MIEREIPIDKIVGELVDEQDGRYYRIDGTERMEPFLMSVVSDTDLWMWISSAGGVTAGRKNSEYALFPYLTDDYLHRAAGRSGPITIIARTIDGQRQLWQPYALQPSTTVVRSLAKHLLGHRVVLEEYHREWRVMFRTSWAPSRDYGWVRESEIINLDEREITIEILDGLLDVMPTGIPSLTEQLLSNLANAYKRTETGRWGTAAIFNMEALISDRAYPAEALAASVVWSAGHRFNAIHLDERVVNTMMRDGLSSTEPSELLVGRPGAYLLHDHSLTISPGKKCNWMVVCDINLNHIDVAKRVEMGVAAGKEQINTVHESIANSAKRLNTLLAAADGFQQSGDAIADAHHLSNVLFNSMRGGVFPHNYQVFLADFMHFLKEHNSICYTRYLEMLQKIGESIERDSLLELAFSQNDHSFIRIVCEYLPLTFSRRHGDPSRPWNRFEIEIEDDNGNELLSFQGNWRDIFQNWEALLYSFPHFIPNTVSKFVNASTLDGHNPYRVVREGFDWEAPDPDNPWSNIGYWGDHQIVYLFRLLKAWKQFDPTGMDDWLNRQLFTYADTPYILVDYEKMVHTPRNTIVYDDQRAEQIAKRVSTIGSDGQLVADGQGNIIHVGLMEKLLVPALAKLSALVPHGGIWMNTQRPEWNDANNALAGFGLSMVTLYYLHQYLSFIRSCVSGNGEGTAIDAAPRSFTISASVSEWLQRQSEALKRHASIADRSEATATARRACMDELGTIASDYRKQTRDRFDHTPTEINANTLDEWCAIALLHLNGAIDSARREDDGLFHSYNLVRFVDDDKIEVSHLDPMLEGQVAVLGAEVLDSEEVVSLVDSLHNSPLYRENQQSFILYPEHIPAAFCERNSLSASVLEQFPSLQGEEELLRTVLSIDNEKQIHFLSGMTNANDINRALDQTNATSDQREAILEVYERMFNHHAYRGRSGSMYGYEGIGSIYWHMIGKLQLAVQECYWNARERGEAAETVSQLGQAYRRVRAGLGFCKSPELFGAIPTDCYSHTPSHAGAQQPGMTGQVKEGILSRIGELGIRVSNGQISLAPGLMPAHEIFPAADKAARFSFCSIPFEIVPITDDRGTPHAEIEWKDGTREQIETGLTLSVEHSRQIFSRSQEIVCVRFFNN